MKNLKGLFIFILVALIALAAAVFILRPKEPTYLGHTMAQWLKILRTNTNSVDDPLRILRISNDDKLGNIWFEVPLSYDLLKAHDFLGMGPSKFHVIVNGQAFSANYERATNGNCYLGYSANYFEPGTNRIQIEFLIFPPPPSEMERFLRASGPVTEFVSSNICRINEMVRIDHSKGVVILWGDLSIQNAFYRIELLDTNSNHIKTISGITTNGTINKSWDFIGDSGKRYSPDSFNSVFHVALTNSP